MKKIFIFACITAALTVFVSASVWEGTAAMDEGLPETGNILRTNSFPKNTAVDVINLENGTIVRLVVSGGLETPGFLALLSRDAAEALGIQGRSPGRIRMAKADDPAAASRLTGGSLVDGETIVDLPDELPAEEISLDNVTDVELSMAPAETRPPENTAAPDAAAFVPPIPQASAEISQAPETPDPASIVAPINPPQADAPVTEPAPDTSPAVAAAPDPVPPASVAAPPETQTPPAAVAAPPMPPRSRAAFSAPLIYGFEKGRYYLQLAAYSVDNPESVEYALSRIDRGLPSAVMEYQNSTLKTPVYRVLIGPLNLGESGALLQRYKSMYHDAFVWLGK